LKTLFSCQAVIALAVLVIVSCSPLKAADGNYFPDDTQLVVVVNLKQIFNSEMIKSQPDAVGELKEVLGQFAGIHIVQKYLKEAGLDAFSDLRTITYVYTSGKELKVSFLILEADFHAGKLSEAAKVGGTTLRAKKSGTEIIYEIAPRSEKPVYASLVNPSTLIATTTEESLADALARASGSKKSGLKKEMKKLLESTDDRQSVAFVSRGAALARLAEGISLPNEESATTFLQTLEVLSGNITLAKGIQFQLKGKAESDEVAKTLTESANGALRILLTLTRQTAEKDYKYLPFVDVVSVLRFTNQGAEILFRGEVSLNTVEKLMKNFPPSRPIKDRK
jgi:hypothetical protein